MKTSGIARIYLRTSSEDQNLQRQEILITNARCTGYYVAAIYRENSTNNRTDRPELLRLLQDLQPGEIVIAERIDRISSLPLSIAAKFVDTIRASGALLSVPGVVDLSDLVDTSSGAARINVQSAQDILLRVVLQFSRDYFEGRCERQRQGIHLAKMAGRYNGRVPNTDMHERVIALKTRGASIAETARLCGCSVSQVKRVWAQHLTTFKGDDVSSPSKGV